jgi:phosphohistidine phosphatase
MEEHLRDEDVRPDLVLCSSAVRARQTLDHVRPALGDALVKIEPSIYAAAADDILELLRGLAEPIRSVMVVGHNPGLQDLAVHLAAGGDRLDELTEKYPTGALATLVFAADSWAGIGALQAELSGYAAPRELD